MASNALPSNTGELIQLGNNMLAGLKSLGASLKITQIPPAQFAGELTAFTNADNAFNAARSAEQGASDAVQTAVADIAAWLGVVRGVLTGVFGLRWNAMWAQAGFTNHSTAVPVKSDDRIALTARLGGVLYGAAKSSGAFDASDGGQRARRWAARCRRPGRRWRWRR